MEKALRFQDFFLMSFVGITPLKKFRKKMETSASFWQQGKYFECQACML